jgi:hypothetical protein
MRVCDRCFNNGLGATSASKQITTSDEQVIDLCSSCFDGFAKFLITQNDGDTNPEKVKGRPPGRPPKNKGD